MRLPGLQASLTRRWYIPLGLIALALLGVTACFVPRRQLHVNLSNRSGAPIRGARLIYIGGTATFPVVENGGVTSIKINCISARGIALSVKNSKGMVNTESLPDSFLPELNEKLMGVDAIVYPGKIDFLAGHRERTAINVDYLLRRLGL